MVNNFKTDRISTGRLNRRTVWQFSVLNLLAILLLVATVAQANPIKQELEDEALHSRLINVALELDWLNQKCRGLSIARNFKQVNRLFIQKYSLSANNYIEGFFGEEIRDYKKQKSRKMVMLLAKKRGCKQALEQDWDRELRTEFNTLFRKTEDSSWYPVVDRLVPSALE